MKTQHFFIVLAIIAVLFTACKKDKEQEQDIPVTGITLNKTELMLALGDTVTLIATVQPDSATNKNVIWMSSNTSVAIVNEKGLVTAIDKGDAAIAVITEDGKKTTTCLITVRDYREKWTGEYIGEYTRSWSLMGGSGSYTEIIVIRVSVSADSCLFIENVKDENYTPKIYTDGYFEQKDVFSWYICKGVMLNDSIVFSGTPGHSPSGTTRYIYNGKKQ